jgi:hypothetical protein
MDSFRKYLVAAVFLALGAGSTGMRPKLIVVITGLALSITSLFGFLVVLAAFAGHPPEWILDAYYSIFPPSAVGGVILLFVVIGLLSFWLFRLALLQIFRRQSRPDGIIGSTPAKTAHNPKDCL